jgi:transcription antitermination factor NusB
MKTANDPRHQKRERRMQHLFEYSFKPTHKYQDIADAIAKLDTIDTQIQQSAPQWPVGKIAKIDLAILRESVWELTATKHEPHKVIIDEAVELAKQYGNEHSAKFVNGVLGTILTVINKSNAINK